MAVDIHELVRSVERMSVEELMTAAIVFVQQGELELAEIFVSRAADLLRLKRLLGKR